MSALEHLIRAAGVLHLLVASANFVAPRLLDYRGSLARVTPIVRDVFIVQNAYTVLVLAGLAGACFAFPADLAGRSPLGRAVAGFLAVLRAAAIAIAWARGSAASVSVVSMMSVMSSGPCLSEDAFRSWPLADGGMARRPLKQSGGGAPDGADPVSHRAGKAAVHRRSGADDHAAPLCASRVLRLLSRRARRLPLPAIRASGVAAAADRRTTRRRSAVRRRMR